MKPLTIFSTLLLLFVLTATTPKQADAQLRVEVAPTLGYGLSVPNQVGDRGSISLGAMAHLYLRQGRLSFILNPDFEYYIFDIEGVTGVQADANLLLGIGGTRAVVMPYLGPGLAITNISGTNSLAENQEGSSMGLNLVAGMRFGRGAVHTFFQGRYTLLDHELYFEDTFDPDASSSLAFQGGILFKISG